VTADARTPPFQARKTAVTAPARVKVWDIAVRVFHWSLVVLFFTAYLSGDDDSLLHVYAGYGVLALVAFRVVWGFIGTRHARFTDFVRGRAATASYLKSVVAFRPQHYLGHNPAGGWMIVALLACLIATCWSGLLVYGAQGHGPLAGVEIRYVPVAMAHDERKASGGEGDGGEHGFWGEVHETLSNLTLALVFLHIAGALVSSAIHRENLVKAMVTGYKTRR
jgi:cytochrome b